MQGVWARGAGWAVRVLGEPQEADHHAVSDHHPHLPGDHKWPAWIQRLETQAICNIKGQTTNFTSQSLSVTGGTKEPGRALSSQRKSPGCVSSGADLHFYNRKKTFMVSRLTRGHFREWCSNSNHQYSTENIHHSGENEQIWSEYSWPTL